MNKKTLFSFLAFMIGNISLLSAQKITNELQGYFQATSDTAMYDYFSFDGNGKTDITGVGNGYYFQKGDTLIVYPDKSIFKFIVKGDKIYGVSEWVDGDVWVKVKDTVIDTNRMDPEESDKTAALLYQYYNLKSTGNEWSLLLEGPDSTYTNKLISLCDSGLSKACLDYAGLKTLEEMGGLATLYSSKKQVKAREPNEEILEFIYYAIELGDTNGYEVLGGYYATIGDIEMARESFELGAELGCGKCDMALFSLELEEESRKLEKKAKPTAPKKAVAKKK